MKNKIRVFEAFAGYGSQSMALRRLGIDFEVIGISEIDKYAIQAYMAVHGDTPNYGDISKIDWSSVPDFDFLTYSFPCTDISTAGQQKGLAEGSGTRSSLLWKCRKAIEAKRPKYLLMENVKNLVSKKFTPYLKEWLKFLEGQGYSNYTKVLNAKDFGVPQNRERVFMVSILGDASFHFPKPFTLEKRLKDVLEQDVNESFYLSEKIVKTFLTRNEKNKAKGNGVKFEPTMGDVIASSILTNAGSRDCDNYVYVVGNTNPSGHGMNGNVFDSNGLCPTLTTNKGEDPRVLVSYERTCKNKRLLSLIKSGKISGRKIEFLDAYNQTINQSNMSFISEPISCAVRGRNPENPSDRNPGIELEQRLELGGDIANCITTVQKDSLVAEPKLTIRQATKKGYIEIPQGGVFDASYPDSTTRRGRVQGDGFISPTLTAGGEPPCLFEGIAEPNVLTPKRTEYGKAMRKDYEAGNIQESRHNMTRLEPRTDGVSNTITTVQKDNLLVEPRLIGGIGEVSFGKQWRQGNRIYDSNGIAMCLMAQAIENAGGNSYLYKVEESEEERLNDVCKETKKEIIGISVNPNSRKLEFKGAKSISPICPTLRATDYKSPHTVWESDAQIECKGKKLNEGDGLYLSTSQDFFHGALDGISRTLKATKSDAGVVQNYRIRKLTPRECFRLMGVSESDIDKIQSAGISKTQQYKMAGNSIVVDVLYYIFKKMFVDKSCEDAQLSLF
jgi:DNA-cytosine methyltransferase